MRAELQAFINENLGNTELDLIIATRLLNEEFQPIVRNFYNGSYSLEDANARILLFTSPLARICIDSQKRIFTDLLWYTAIEYAGQTKDLIKFKDSDTWNNYAAAFPDFESGFIDACNTIPSIGYSTVSEKSKCLYNLYNALCVCEPSIGRSDTFRDFLKNIKSYVLDNIPKEKLNNSLLKPAFVDDSKLAEGKLFYNMPTSPVTDSIMKIMQSRGNLTALKERNPKISHGQKLTISRGTKNKDLRQITTKTKTSDITISVSLPDIENALKNNKGAKKLFVFTGMKISEQALAEGNLRQDYISFPLQELVNNGNYSNVRSARAGFNSGMEILTSIKVKGQFHKGKKEVLQDSLRVLFTGSDIKNGTCYVYLNPRVNWNFVNAFYTVMPRYCFSLPNRSFDLLYYIFYIARQNTKEITERGYFTISMKAVQMRLGLPDPSETKDQNRDIIKAINTAIDEILSADNSQGFNIEVVRPENSSVSEFLETGYLKITISGDYAADYFKRLSQIQSKQIETHKKRNQAIEDKARAKALKEKLERESKSS